MEMMSRRRFCALMGGAGAPMLLAGCTKNKGEVPPAVEAADPDDVLRIGMSTWDWSIFPPTTTSPFGLSLSDCVTETLYAVDAGGAVAAVLAVGDPVPQGEGEWRISLRKSYFSDGRRVRARDVAASFGAARAGSKVYDWLLRHVTALEVAGDRELVVRCDVPSYPLLRERLAMVHVVPEARITNSEDGLIGSGPWALSLDSAGPKDQGSATAASATFYPNPRYIGAYPAAAARMVIEKSDATGRVVDQCDGFTSCLCDVPFDATDELAERGCTIEEVQGFDATFVAFNSSHSPWDRAQVRQAILWCIDAQTIVDEVLVGHATVATSFLPQGFPHYRRAATVFEFDPERGLELLREQGVAPGAITMCAGPRGEDVRAGLLVKENLEAVGFTVDFVAGKGLSGLYDIEDEPAVDMAIYSDDPHVLGSDPDLLMGWWLRYYVAAQAPDAEEYDLIAGAWLKNSEAESLLQMLDAALTVDESEREGAWGVCMDYLSDQVPLYPLFHRNELTASWKDNPSPRGTRIEGDFRPTSSRFRVADIRSVGA